MHIPKFSFLSLSHPTYSFLPLLGMFPPPPYCFNFCFMVYLSIVSFCNISRYVCVCAWTNLTLSYLDKWQLAFLHLDFLFHLTICLGGHSIALYIDYPHSFLYLQDTLLFTFHSLFSLLLMEFFSITNSTIMSSFTHEPFFHFLQMSLSL